MIAALFWQTKRSCSNPSGSRERIMFRASLRFFPPVRSHRSEGRTMSAPIMVRKELVISSRRDVENLPWRSSHWAGPRAQSSPAASAPLESQCSCQLPPGCSSSQSRSRGSPRRRALWIRESGRAHDAAVTSSKTCDRSRAVAGQCAATGRGGNRLSSVGGTASANTRESTSTRAGGSVVGGIAV